MGYVDAATAWLGDTWNGWKSNPNIVPGGGNAIYERARVEIDAAVARGMGEGQARDLRSDVDEYQAEGNIEGAQDVINVARAYGPEGNYSNPDDVTAIDVKKDIDEATDKVKLAVGTGVGLYVLGAVVLLAFALRR